MSVERSLRLATSGLTLTEAWAFVMSALDEIADPHIEISPVWSSADGFAESKFDVVVSGTVTR